MIGSFLVRCESQDFIRRSCCMAVTASSDFLRLTCLFDGQRRSLSGFLGLNPPEI